MSMEGFSGTWYIHWVAGQGPLGVQAGWQIVIDPEEGENAARFALLKPGENGWHPVASSDSDHPLLLINGQLRWDGTTSDGTPLRFYISTAEATTRDGKTSVSLYGTTLLGDPDQVAVWGANDGPPPDPEP